MTKIDLITGFLGSGKTTFLKNYVKYLLSLNQKVCILEFDYGAVNVDMMLLQEFNDVCDIEMVAGGCDYDCHLRRFKTKLISMGMKKYDRVIIEPSGIFDCDEFFDTLYEEPLNAWYEIGSIIDVVDVNISKELSDKSKYILTSQLANAGVVLLSKTQCYFETKISDCIDFLSSLMAEKKMIFDQNKVISKDFSLYNNEDYKLISNASYSSQEHTKMDVMNQNEYETLYYLNSSFNKEELEDKSLRLLNDNSFGNVLRIKGFLNDSNTWYEFNITSNECNIHPILNGQDVTIIIGEHINKEKIDLFLQNKVV